MNKNNVVLPVVLILAAALVVGGFVLLKKHRDSVIPPPVTVVEKPVVEKPEPVEEEPAPQPRRQRQRRDLNSSINTMNPIQTQNMPTREEAVDAAWDILTAYREASPQEKQQMAMVMYMASGLLNGIAQNAGQFIQQMPQDQRDRLVNSAGTSLELLSAVQEEMMNNVTPEEVQVFGGVFQSMQNLNESLMNAALF
jgi:flagellar biosynthesis GTPase FlhF